MNCPSGPAPEVTVAHVLKVFLPEYLDRHPLPAHHLKVLRRLAQCRSGERGWTVWHCPHCGRTHPQGSGYVHPVSRPRARTQQSLPSRNRSQHHDVRQNSTRRLPRITACQRHMVLRSQLQQTLHKPIHPALRQIRRQRQ